MICSIVVAASENGVIGNAGDLPWHLPDDFRFFKEKTTGHTIIMGRKTFESLGKPLKNRRNIVITRQKDWNEEGAERAGGLKEAIEMSENEQVFIIGGGEIYRQSLEQDLVDRIFLTRVHGRFEGDTFFEIPKDEGWDLVEEKYHAKDEKHNFPFTIQTWLKRNKKS